MSDAHDELGSLGRLAIQGSQLEPLRERMVSFISTHETTVDLRTLRSRTVTEQPLSALVTEERNGRLE